MHELILSWLEVKLRELIVRSAGGTSGEFNRSPYLQCSIRQQAGWHFRVDMAQNGVQRMRLIRVELMKLSPATSHTKSLPDLATFFAAANDHSRGRLMINHLAHFMA